MGRCVPYVMREPGTKSQAHAIAKCSGMFDQSKKPTVHHTPGDPPQEHDQSRHGRFINRFLPAFKHIGSVIARREGTQEVFSGGAGGHALSWPKAKEEFLSQYGRTPQSNEFIAGFVDTTTGEFLTREEAKSRLTTNIRKKKKQKRQSKRKINPMRIDPTRTTMLRKRWMADVRKRFARLKKDLYQLIAVEDAFGFGVERNQFVAQHYGPGPHPGTGSTQTEAHTRKSRGVEEITLYGSKVRVFRNPTNRQAKQLLSKARRGKYGDLSKLRGLMSKDGDLYLWEAHSGVHDVVAQRLGVIVDKSIEDEGRFIFGSFGSIDAQYEKLTLHHYGPGPHPGTGTEQTEHGGGEGNVRREIKAIPKGECGLCFKNAQRYATENETDSTRVVHGKVSNLSGKRIAHAWVETDDSVIDPTQGVQMDKEKWYALMSAKADNRYTVEESLILAVRTNTFGPWTESEVADLREPGGTGTSPSDYHKKITGTAAFKKWFGDSKVVDENGKPLIVYHGSHSPKPFTTFRPGTGWFIDSTHLASAYGGGETRFVRGGRVYPVYLSIKNPYQGYARGRSEIEHLKQLGYDGLQVGHIWHVFSQSQIKSIFNPSPSADDPDILNEVTINNRWAFLTETGRLENFANWLKDRTTRWILEKKYGPDITGALRLGPQDIPFNTGTPWLQKYINEAYSRGVGRAYNAVRQKFPEQMEQRVDFFAGTREEFLRQAFGRPASLDRIKLLGSRAFDDLENINSDMSTKISRELVDGMIQGLSPRDVARNISHEVDISRNRALTIARTETIRAHSEGALDSMESLGITEVGVAVEWNTSTGSSIPSYDIGNPPTGYPSPCALCAPLSGIVLHISEARGMFPRHPNCRCTPVPVNIDVVQVSQIRTRARIIKAIQDSLAAEIPKRARGTRTISQQRRLSRWRGADVKIHRKRPGSK